MPFLPPTLSSEGCLPYKGRGVSLSALPKDTTSELSHLAPINSRLNVVVRIPTPLGVGRNGCCPSRGSQLPQALPFNFLLCCPLNNRRKAAHSFFEIGRLFSLFLFSCPSLAVPRLLILLLLFMSGNVHPNPGPIFPCSVYLELLAALALGAVPTLPQHCDSLLRLLRHVHLYCTIWSPSANAALSPHPRLQTSYPPSAHSISSPSAPSPPSLAPGCLSVPPAFSPP